METSQQIKFCPCAPKSSEQDERQAMSIYFQLKEMMAMANRDGFTRIMRVTHETCRQTEMIDDMLNMRYATVRYLRRLVWYEIYKSGCYFTRGSSLMLRVV